ncbi:hypothetical protein GCM10007856_56300 [Azospirillum oryzae]|nr:hypothetical protein GCM10007856_56300 [Azospirillum oryzae]
MARIGKGTADAAASQGMSRPASGASSAINAAAITAAMRPNTARESKMAVSRLIPIPLSLIFLRRHRLSASQPAAGIAPGGAGPLTS